MTFKQAIYVYDASFWLLLVFAILFKDCCDDIYSLDKLSMWVEECDSSVPFYVSGIKCI
jgi:hypothetical protein